MTQHKRGIFNVPPALIIHAIIVMACLALIAILVGSLLSFPDDANAENELKNFVGVVKAFAESDKDSMDAFIAFDGSYFFVMFDDSYRGISGHSKNSEAMSGSGLVRDSCGRRCLCSYGPEVEGKIEGQGLEFQQLACEYLSKQLIIETGIKSRVEGIILGPNNFETNMGEEKADYGLGGTPYSLLILGASPSTGDNPRIGLPVTLVKMEDKILVHPKEAGNTPSPTDLLIETPKELMCGPESSNICKGLKYNSCVEYDDLWYRCNVGGFPEANIKTEDPVCDTTRAPLGCS